MHGLLSSFARCSAARLSTGNGKFVPGFHSQLPPFLKGDGGGFFPTVASLQIPPRPPLEKGGANAGTNLPFRVLSILRALLWLRLSRAMNQTSSIPKRFRNRCSRSCFAFSAIACSEVCTGSPGPSVQSVFPFQAASPPQVLPRCLGRRVLFPDLTPHRLSAAFSHDHALCPWILSRRDLPPR